MQHLINEKLQALACPLSLFVPIAQIVSRTTLTQALKGEKNLDRNLVEKLITVLNEMAELKHVSRIAPDWSDAENIRFQLQQRRLFKQLVAYDEDQVRELLGVS